MGIYAGLDMALHLPSLFHPFPLLVFPFKSLCFSLYCMSIFPGSMFVFCLSYVEHYLSVSASFFLLFTEGKIYVMYLNLLFFF